MARTVISRVSARKGSWYCRVRRKNVDIARSFDLKSGAELWEKQVIAAIDAGIFKREDWIGKHGEITKKKTAAKADAFATTIHKPARELSFGEVLERYKQTVTIKKKGQKEESLKISKLQRDPLANRPLKDLDSADLAFWRDAKLKEGLAPATVRLYLAIVSHMFNIARREWGMKELVNPVEDIAKPKVNNERERRLHPEEERYLLDAIDNPCVVAHRRNKYIGPIVRFALETAMRRSEILSLEWQNVDMQQKTAKLVDTKNGETRMVPLSPRALVALESLQVRNAHKTQGSIFLTTASGLHQSWIRAIERAKRCYQLDCETDGRTPDKAFLNDLHFHDLRHEGTSRLAEKLSNVLELSSVTGHKDLRMLKRYYHPKAEELAKKLE